MGEVVTFKCKACKYYFRFHMGVGFSEFRSICESRPRMRAGEWGEKCKKLLEQYPKGTATTYNAMCFCKSCNRYYCEPRIVFCVPKKGYHFKFEDPNSDIVPIDVIREHYQELEKETMICQKCGEIVSIIEDYDKVLCPIRGKYMEYEEAGNWD